MSVRAQSPGECTTQYLTVKALYLVFAAVGLVLSRAVDGGEEQLGVGQEGVSPLQVSPQLLLHVEVSVSHLRETRELRLISNISSGERNKSPSSL